MTVANMKGDWTSGNLVLQDADSTTTHKFGSDGQFTLADGGTVTQGTNPTTGVTLSTVTGQITTVAGTLAAAGEEAFTVTNTKCAATSVVVANIASNAGNGTPAVFVTAVAAGSFELTVTNLHASAALSTALVINFAVIGGAAT